MSPDDLPDFSQSPWTGVSTFIELPQPNLHGNRFAALAVPDDGQMDQSASVQPKQFPVPCTPSEMEVRTHNLTHLPFRAWCPHCVQGKGKASQHRTLSERSPVIQVDYGFLTVPDSKEQITVMTAIDIITGLATASVVTSKGANLHAVTELKRFILETGRSFAFLQSDQEPAIKAVLQAVIKQLPGLTLRGAPAHSSATQGSVERYHQTLFSQIRTIKIQIETEYKIQMKLDSVLLPWMVRHSAWLLNRFLIHSDGLTSYQRAWGKVYSNAICSFGEVVQCKKTPAASKFESCWFKGIWIGRCAETDESLALTHSGVQRSRTIKRVPLEEQKDFTTLQTVKGLPWDPKQTGMYDPSFTLPLRFIPPQITTHSEPIQPSPSEQVPDVAEVGDDVGGSGDVQMDDSIASVPRRRLTRKVDPAQTVYSQGLVRQRSHDLDVDDSQATQFQRVATLTVDGSTRSLPTNDEILVPDIQPQDEFPEHLLRQGIQDEMTSITSFETFIPVNVDEIPVPISEVIPSRFVDKWKNSRSSQGW